MIYVIIYLNWIEKGFWMSKKRVLIIKLGAIGDVVHTTIIASAIKQKHPDWIVDFLTITPIISLIENNQYVDNIYDWDFSQRKSLKYILKIGKILFKNRYDVIFDPTVSLRTLLLSIIALPKKIMTKKFYGGLWVEDYFMMAKRAIKDLEMPNRLYIGTNEEADKKIENDIKDYPKPHIAIIPGRNNDKTRPGRVWNINKWKELTNLLNQNYNGTVFVIGAGNEKEYHQVLLDEKIVMKTGEYSLVESSSFLSKMDLVISGDTGPIHIASAHNTKTLAILGSTSPKQIKPYGENGHWISAKTECLHCWKKECKYLKDGEIYTPCMEALSAQEVFEKVKEIL